MDYGGTFNDISTVSQFWEWFQGPLTDVLNSTSPDTIALYTSGHYLIGSAQLRQLRVQSNSCQIPSQFSSQISNCISQDFDEDKSSFGPSFSPTKYYWSKPRGAPFYGILGQQYHDGGYKQLFTGANAIALATELEVPKKISQSIEKKGR